MQKKKKMQGSRHNGSKDENQSVQAAKNMRQYRHLKWSDTCTYELDGVASNCLCFNITGLVFYSLRRMLAWLGKNTFMKSCISKLGFGVFLEVEQ